MTGPQRSAGILTASSQFHRSLSPAASLLRRTARLPEFAVIADYRQAMSITLDLHQAGLRGSAAHSASLTNASLDYAENWLAEDDILVAARAHGAELGCSSISPSAGAAIRLLASTCAARAVVEVGTGTGVASLWLMGGMQRDGILTTVDSDSEHQRAARQVFLEAGVPANKFRLINGVAAEVLPRLTDGAYDMVFIDADRMNYLRYYEQAVRLLRPGGVVVFDGVLSDGRLADPSAQDNLTVALREMLATVRSDERVVPALVPAGGGLLAAVKN